MVYADGQNNTYIIHIHFKVWSKIKRKMEIPKRNNLVLKLYGPINLVTKFCLYFSNYFDDIVHCGHHKSKTVKFVVIFVGIPR